MADVTRGGLLRVRGGRAVLRLAAVLAAVTLPACAAPEPAATPSVIREVTQLDVDGQTRAYGLFVPSETRAPSPLVVVLHDAGGSGDTIVQVTQFDRFATANGFAVRVRCELADRVAGVASVAGTMLLEGYVGATADPPPVMAVAEHWAEANACPGAPAVSTAPR